MNIGYLDIPYGEMSKYFAKVAEKGDVCKIMPRGRFGILRDGTIQFQTLVCSDLGGKSTGVSAEFCRNCIIKENT